MAATSPITTQLFSRGSEWRLWDLHVHTPASFQWSGATLRTMNAEQQIVAIDSVINGLNTALPSVFAVMDYWTFDGYLAIRKRSQEAGAPLLEKKVFPGIELRLVSPTEYRLNAHVIFSDEITEQELLDFKQRLIVGLIDRGLSDECLIQLARTKMGADKLQKHGFKKTEVDSDADIAYRAGATVAEITAESFMKAVQSVPEGKAVIMMPWDTNDGLSEAKWVEHYTYVLSLMKCSPIFETRRWELRCAFVGQEIPENAQFFQAFQAALDNTPRLAVSGSDGHSVADYGKYPSGKATWIKADPTFSGLLQAIREPKNRSYIGNKPPKLLHVESNTTHFVEHLSIIKDAGSLPGEQWFDQVDIPLNSDLVAIIGNKGSGKSALADVLALLGNTKNTTHFSFLNNNRFRSPRQNKSKHFVGTLRWVNKTPATLRLSDNPKPENAERIKYIPQAFFEDLCNEYVRGDSDRFEQELRAVIFSHTEPSKREGATTFDALLKARESALLASLRELRSELAATNNSIEHIEGQLNPEVKQSLQSKLELKVREIDEHQKLKPAAIDKPGGQTTPEEEISAKELTEIEKKLAELAELQTKAQLAESTASSSTAAIQRLRERIGSLKRQIAISGEEMARDLKSVGLEFQDIVKFETYEEKLQEFQDSAVVAIQKNQQELATLSNDITALQTNQTTIRSKLGAPMRLYQENMANLELWDAKNKLLIGEETIPNTQKALEAQIREIDGLPIALAEQKEKRIETAKAIFGALLKQKNLREELYGPVQKLIDDNPLIKNDYRLRFQNSLVIKNFHKDFFDLVKQNGGKFRGEEEGREELKKIVEKYDINTESGAIGLSQEILAELEAGLIASGSTGQGVSKAMRNNKHSRELYDLLFDFEFLEPRYTLLFQDAQIEQLSPGQRGALLLIFYLLVDKDRSPIVLDQPEENLDNETVVSLLVPVVTQAKEHRQIIMVTHNPNLAVVCDAEQIIHSRFDRKNQSSIIYTSGAIENSDMNKKVVDVLEGTKPAFNNRGSKYI